MKVEINKMLREKGKNCYIKSNKHFINLLKYISLFSMFITTYHNFRNLINLSSEINLVIRGSGNQSLLNDSFYIEPSEVFVNGILRDSCKMFCELENEVNNVTLIFNTSIESCEIMFAELDNIIKIDLFNFDFSIVTSMAFMFKNLANLEKINFGNINTSSVIDMRGVFYNCTKLEILDLSNFDTSLATTMEEMLYNCTNLISIDLSNLNTKKVQTMRRLIYN